VQPAAVAGSPLARAGQRAFRHNRTPFGERQPPVRAATMSGPTRGTRTPPVIWLTRLTPETGVRHVGQRRCGRLAAWLGVPGDADMQVCRQGEDLRYQERPGRGCRRCSPIHEAPHSPWHCTGQRNMKCGLCRQPLGPVWPHPAANSIAPAGRREADDGAVRYLRLAVPRHYA